MFTGLIQAIGRIQSRQAMGGDMRLWIALRDLPRDGLHLGESIAVSGVCLTVVGFDDETFSADVSNETLALTTLGRLAEGAAVNLERSLLPTTRMGGHLVSGHVDGMGRVERITDDGRSQRWRFTVPQPLLRYVATKGSVAVDGVSLTVNQADDAGFEVNLVPHTVAHTSFQHAAIGDEANIEVDMVARYVERLAATRDWT